MRLVPHRALLSSALLCFAAGRLEAAPPTITSIAPAGAERGKVATLTIAGANLTAKSRLLFSFPVTQRLLPDAKPNPAQVRLEITVPASVPHGIYPVRVLTEDGVSALTFFAVDAFPSLPEVEDNSSFEKAQKVPFPVVIDGQCGGGDVDFYRFHVNKGQRVVIETEAARMGSGVLPQIRITDAARRLIAADDSQRLRGDCRVWFVAAAEGDYVVEFSDSRYRGGNPPQYRLRIADYDFADEVFPLGGRQGDKVEFTLWGGNLERELRVVRLLGPPTPDLASPDVRPLDLRGTLKPGMLSPEIAVGAYPEQLGGKDKKAPLVAPPLTLNGRFDKRGEIHRYRFPVQAGQRYRFTVEAEALGSYLDGVLRVLDQAGKQLARIDDVDLPPAAPGQPATKSADPVAEIAVPAGVSQLEVELRDGLGRGGINFGYRLTIELARPDFTLEQLAGDINLPAGGSILVPVTVKRRGYNGPIQLGIATLPAGVTLLGGYVPDAATSGLMTLTTAANVALPRPLHLAIEGRGLGKDRDVHALARQRLVLSRDGNVAASTFHLAHFALAMTSAAPFSLQGPASVELVHGYPATVPIRLKRATKPVVPAIEVTALAAAPGVPPPTGLAFKSASAPPNAAATSLIITASPTVPIGRQGDLALQGKAKVNNKDETVSGPAIAVTVVRPFDVVLATPTLVFRPGQTAMLKVRVDRRPVFREPLQLKLDGLPKGLTLAAPLQPIPPTQAEMQISLKADAKATAAGGQLTLNCSTTISGMPYIHPPMTVAFQLRP